MSFSADGNKSHGLHALSGGRIITSGTWSASSSGSYGIVATAAGRLELGGTYTVSDNTSYGTFIVDQSQAVTTGTATFSNNNNIGIFVSGLTTFLQAATLNVGGGAQTIAIHIQEMSEFLMVGSCGVPCTGTTNVQYMSRLRDRNTGGVPSPSVTADSVRSSF
jgi:hypothetical protein